MLRADMKLHHHKKLKCLFRQEQIETLPETIKWPLLLHTFVSLQEQFRHSIASWLDRHRQWRETFSKQKLVDRFLGQIQGRQHGSLGKLAHEKVSVFFCDECDVAIFELIDV